MARRLGWLVMALQLAVGAVACAPEDCIKVSVNGCVGTMAYAKITGVIDGSCPGTIGAKVYYNELAKLCFYKT